MTSKKNSTSVYLCSLIFALLSQSCQDNFAYLQYEKTDKKSINFLYNVRLQLDPNGALAVDDEIRKDLTDLLGGGVNTLLVNGVKPGQLKLMLLAIRQDPLFSQFKYLVDMQVSIWNHYFLTCKGNFQCEAPAHIIDPLVTIALDNQDIISGYYTFDEPASYGISAQYQESVYSAIRSLDPNLTDRPIALAQTMAFSKKEFYSKAAQDVLYLSQYSPYQDVQLSWFYQLDTLGMLDVPMVIILPTYGFSCRSSALRTYSAILGALNYINKLDIVAGIGFYAFQPYGVWETYAISNCEEMKNEALLALGH